MKNIKKIAIVASISVASLSAVADQSTEANNTALALKIETTEKQGIVLPAEQLKTTDLYACEGVGGCDFPGERPHRNNSWWDTLKDIIGGGSSAELSANAQSTKSLDDDFA